MMNPSNPYSSILQQQMGPQGMGGGIAPIQPQPMQSPAPMQQPQQPPQQQQGGMMAGMMKSDERSKKEIERLSAQNSALTRALGSQASYPNTAAPSSGMQALGQQENLGPMQARFSDAPADRVAAQNAALGQAPQASVAQPAPSAGFQVPRDMPDLTALDEAYRRIGATSGG